VKQVVMFSGGIGSWAAARRRIPAITKAYLPHRDVSRRAWLRCDYCKAEMPHQYTNDGLVCGMCGL